jgi:hypothetical protein
MAGNDGSGQVSLGYLQMCVPVRVSWTDVIFVSNSSREWITVHRTSETGRTCINLVLLFLIDVVVDFLRYVQLFSFI